MNPTTIPTLAVKHPYYCSDGCYYSNNCETKWASLASFLGEMGAADVDMNLVWRWDLKSHGDDDNLGADWSTANLHLYVMHQRKAAPHTHIVSVARADEPAIITFLSKHWETMQAIWAPFTASTDLAKEAAAAWRAHRIAVLRAELDALTAAEVERIDRAGGR